LASNKAPNLSAWNKRSLPSDERYHLIKDHK
jgi:hypothetical protein